MDDIKALRGASLTLTVLAFAAAAIIGGAGVLAQVPVQTPPVGATPTSASQSSLVNPPGSTVVTNSATGTTGATVATLPGVAGKTTYLCGFSISSDATAALAGTATVTGTIGGTMSYIQNVGSATAAGILAQSFLPCIPASAVNTPIAINSVAAGTGGNTAVSAWGFQL